jgi:hypothetical protein
MANSKHRAGQKAKPTERFKTLKEAVEAHDERAGEALLLRGALQDAINQLPSKDAKIAACRAVARVSGDFVGIRCQLVRFKRDVPGKKGHWPWFRRGDYAIAGLENYADLCGTPGVLVYTLRSDFTTDLPRDIMEFVR